MNQINWPFSDTIAGYITAADVDKGTFSLKTPGGTEFSGKLTPSTFGEFVRNLGEGYKDAMGPLKDINGAGQLYVCLRRVLSRRRRLQL